MSARAHARRRGGRLLPVVAVVTGVLGAAAVGGSVLVARDESTAAAEQAPPPAATEPSAEPERPAGTAPEVTGEGIAALPDPDWVARVALDGDLPPRAVTAYAGAALRLGQDTPGCGLGWNTLAALGEVESSHGSTNGGQLDADGDVSPPVVGVPLDGDGVRAIRDTDGGRLDGDPTWDRAVGPLQFIPTTWAAYEADGNGDGRADPQNVDDAALAAARYLCDDGRDLTVEADWIAAVAAYNDDVAYNNAVAEAADRYAALEP